MDQTFVFYFFSLPLYLSLEKAPVSDVEGRENEIFDGRKMILLCPYFTAWFRSRCLSGEKFLTIHLKSNPDGKWLRFRALPLNPLYDEIYYQFYYSVREMESKAKQKYIYL